MIEVGLVIFILPWCFTGTLELIFYSQQLIRLIFLKDMTCQC